MSEAEDIKKSIIELVDQLKEGPLAEKLFVQSFATARETEDEAASYFPEFFGDFCTESTGILEKVRGIIEELTRSGTDIAPQELAEAFRFCHMLKGSAATMGFNQMSYLAHGLERLFEELKEERAKPTEDVVAALSAGCKLLERSVVLKSQSQPS